MNRKFLTLVVIIGLAVLLTGGSLMASNMGFKLNLPLYAAGEAVPESGTSFDGTNTLSLPYNKQTGLTDAGTLGTDIGGFSNFGGGPVLNIQRLTRGNNGLSAYDGAARGDNFTLIDGQGYRVRVSAHVDYIVVGSHDPSLPVTLAAAGTAVPEGGNSFDGTNKYGYPYHSTAGDAGGLGTEIGGFADFGGGPVLNIQRLTRNNNGLSAYDGAARGDNFTLIPGDAYRVRVSADVTFVPSHF